MTAANITTRLIKGKTTDWINTSFPSKIIRLLKQMFKLEAQGNMFVVLHAIRKSAIIRNKTVALCAIFTLVRKLNVKNTDISLPKLRRPH